MSREKRNEWIEDVKAKVIFDGQQTDKATEEILYLYDEVVFEIEGRINALYAKYAADNQLTAAEAYQMISGKEYSVWRKSIDAFIADVAAEGAESKTLLELNTLAMKSRISREEKLLTDVYRHMAQLAGDTSSELTGLLGDIVRSDYLRSCYRLQVGIGVGFEVGQISDRVVSTLLNHPWAQKKFSKAVWDNVDTLSALAKREITRGFVTGASQQRMVKAINDVMGKGRAVTERLVRTECKYFANQAELMGYKENGIEQYMYIGGSEGGYNCDCASLNGQVFEVSKAVAGVNFPPMHPNCLCSIRAYFENSLFDSKKNVTPLDKEVSYEKWKAQFVDNPATPPKVALKSNEQAALNSYISSESYKVNEKLRSGAKLSSSEKRMVASLDSALEKMPVFEGTVYRSISDMGIDSVDDFVKAHQVGAFKQFVAYTSSSTEVFDDGLPIQYVIKSKTGRDIRAHNALEKEVLFKRNSTFIVTRVEGNTIFLEEC